MLLWGAFAFTSFLTPSILFSVVHPVLRGLERAAVPLLVATVTASLPIEVAQIGDGWASVSDVSTFWSVLFDTSVGSAWQVEAGAALLLVLACFWRGRGRRAAIALAAGGVLTTLSLTGHAAIHEGWLGLAHHANDALHVLAAGAWLGALLPLLPLLNHVDGTDLGQRAVTALRRFSTAGHVTVSLVLATGATNTALVLGRVPTDWSRPYQAMLSAKIVLVALMVCLAVVNRYVFVRRMGQDRRRGTEKVKAVTLIEIGLGASVLGLVAVFGMLEPG